MAIRETRIEHDGGVTTVETETEPSKYGGTVTIYFGSSYTLRVDEYSLGKLREILYEASKDLKAYGALARSIAQDADSASDEELEAADEILKSQTDEQSDKTWNSNDPVNW